LRSILNPAEGRAPQSATGGPRLIPVLKANAYGHGAVPCARALAAAGAEAFGVALVEEGETLRTAGIAQEILVLEGSWPGQEESLARSNLTATVYSPDGVRRLEDAGRKLCRQISVHIKIDTGMARLGVAWDRIEPLLGALREASFLRLGGTYSHLAAAEEDDPAFTDEQIRRFEYSLLQIRRSGLDPGELHLANSAGLLFHPRLRSQSARPGIALYGYSPSPVRGREWFRPVLTLKSRVGWLHQVSEGESIGYNRRFFALRPTRIATLPVGYADGYRRDLAGKSGVILRGRWAEVLGAISMDMIVIDVTDLPEVCPGEEAILLGATATCRFDAADWAARVGTIPYEIVCGIGSRIPRIYLGGTGPECRHESCRP
jgi:alanine racemase